MLHLLKEDQKKELLPYTKTSLAFLPFCDELVELNLDFKGIDYKNLDNLLVREWAASEEGIDKRDEKFTQCYLKEERNVFGMIGLRHALGMQKKMVDALSKEKAAQLYHFVHVFKNDPIDGYEASVRENKLPHPLGIECFDANKITTEDIVSEIIKQIELKSAIINEGQGQQTKAKKAAPTKLQFYNQELLLPLGSNAEDESFARKIIELLKKYGLVTTAKKRALTENILCIRPLCYLLYELEAESCLTDSFVNKAISVAKSASIIIEICDCLRDMKFKLNQSHYLLFLDNTERLDDIYWVISRQQVSLELLDDYFANLKIDGVSVPNQ